MLRPILLILLFSIKPVEIFVRVPEQYLLLESNSVHNADIRLKSSIRPKPKPQCLGCSSFGRKNIRPI